MSSNIYRQYYVDGNSDLRKRSTKQGRAPLPDDLKMLRVNITMSREAKKTIKNKAEKMGMSFSAYLELSGILYTPELLNT